MKKWLIFLLLPLLFLTGCMQSVLLSIPRGFTEKEEHFDPEGFQDYTDYCKYIYSEVAPFSNDARYHAVTAGEIPEIRAYFENFAGWMETEDRLNEYDFSPECITEGDYVLIKTKEGQRIGDGRYSKYDDYTVYFFDTGSLTLYYIHTNI